MSAEKVTELETKSDEARDAARYRYLRSEKRREALHLTGPNAGVWCDTEDENGTLFLLTEEDLDAAIDAALAAQQKPKSDEPKKAPIQVIQTTPDNTPNNAI